jgi:trigger factor
MAAVAENVKTTVTELPESRVRVEAEVSPKELERRMQDTARRLAKDMRMPGFRRGKVPPPVVIKQVGRDAILDETVRGQLGRWYLDAVDASGIHPVGEPDLDLGDLPPAGAPLAFTFEIGVRPTAKLGEYKGVEVGKREAAADEAAVDAEVDALRERMASLDTKEAAAETGDFVVMDYKGFLDGEPFEGGEGSDQLLELGSGNLIPGFEEGLIGATAGEDRKVEVTFPEDYQAEHLAGKAATFEVKVKEVKAKQLPELDDEFAVNAAGFDTLAELREDIAGKLRETEDERIEGEFREAVLDAVVAAADVHVPEPLVEARAKELWDRMIHSMSHQGISKEMYLQISQKSEEEIIEEARPDARQALRREAVIAAVVEAESITPSDGDVLDALGASAAREGTTPEKLRDRLEKNGRLDELKDDLSQRQAVDFLAEHAKSISVEQAKARDGIWTPDKDEREAEGSQAGGRARLWTPGDA